MQIDSQRYLDLVEKHGSLIFFDSESSGRQGDYDKLLVTSLKPYGQKATTFTIGENACDKGLVRDTKEALESADAWVTYYGKGFDIPLLNTRLTRWGYHPVDPRPHIDMYFTLKPKMLTGRKSQAHLLEFLQDTMELMGIEPQVKMTVSPNVWADLWTNFRRNINILISRCESDTAGLEALYRVTRHLIRDIKR